MAFTIDPPDVTTIGQPLPGQPDNLKMAPEKVFVSYDQKASKPSENQEPVENQKQANISESAAAKANAQASAPSKEETLPLSTKLSALARKEQAQRAKEAELVRREKELSAKLADGEKFSQLKTKIAAKDYSAAEELGMTHEEHTKYLLEKEAKEDPAERRVRELEGRLEALKKHQEEKEVKDYEANQGLWKKEIASIVSAGPEFSAIKRMGQGGIEAVLRHINDSFEEDGTELSAEEACREIIVALKERRQKMDELLQEEEAATKPQRLGPPKTSSAPQTITQQMTVTSQKAVKKPFHLMSDSEQIEEARRRVMAERMAR